MCLRVSVLCIYSTRYCATQSHSQSHVFVHDDVAKMSLMSPMCVFPLKNNMFSVQVPQTSFKHKTSTSLLHVF